MSSELIHVSGDRVDWDGVVGQTAALFNPFVAAGRVIARLGACMVEISRFKHLSAELERRHRLAGEVLLVRQSTIVSLFEAEREHSRQTRVESAALVAGYDRMVRQVCGIGVPRRFYDLAQVVLPAMAVQIAELTRIRGDNLVRLSHGIRLAETVAAVAAWRRTGGA